MTIEYRQSSQIPAIMDEIERDIRQRGLQAGERYLTTEEIARNFEVRIASINRAMQVMPFCEKRTKDDQYGGYVTCFEQ